MTDSHVSTKAEARLATRDDLPAMEALETRATRGLSASYLDAQDAGQLLVVLGLVDGEVRGRLLLDLNEDNELRPEMKLLWVDPAARRRGLGSAMTSFMEARAGELGFDEVFLGVSPEHPAAIPLYISLDYTPTGDHRDAVNLSVIDPDIQVSDHPTEAIYRKSLRLR